MALIKLTVVHAKDDKEDILLNFNIITFIARVEKEDPYHKDGARSMVTLKNGIFGSDILFVTQDMDHIYRTS